MLDFNNEGDSLVCPTKMAKVFKRDGRLANFDPQKIIDAIYKALVSVGHDSRELATRLGSKVVSEIDSEFGLKIIPSVENVQDIVEKVLVKNKFANAAKAYILYRDRRAEIREVKKFLGVSDDLGLSINAAKVLKKRYLLKDQEGAIIETPLQMFRRVAKAIAKADLLYGRKQDVEEIEQDFFEALARLEFLPNTPTLMNAGTRVGQLSACFVLPVKDSIKDIFDAVKYMALIHQSGGGTGFSFSRLRPKGDVVKTTKGIASGPVSFMRVFDAATEIIRQGGRRRGANMGVLSVYHPDILDFITCKEKEGHLTNFNLSVAVDDKFMQKVKTGGKYELVNPRTGEVVDKLSARNVFDLIVGASWSTGDPGLIFIDRINKANPTPSVGEIESTNPCGEQPLLPYESCNLGSINLAKMVKGKEIDWKKLETTVRLAVHFLDNVIDANKYPLAQIAQATYANRKIGLGVMGLAEMLIKLGIPYNSKRALEAAEDIARFITFHGRKKSTELARKRGSFPNFPKSIWKKKGLKALRNATVTTIAPTGTISIIANVTSGIEPLFAISFVRSVMEGARLIEVNPLFERMAKKNGFYTRKLALEIAREGSIGEMKEIPKSLRKLFVTALRIKLEWHVKMQAAFQKHIDNAVAKTVNLPPQATLDDVRKTYLSAHRLGCKGVTVYRYGSRKEQVLYLGSMLPRVEAEDRYTSAESEYSGGCPVSYCPY